MSSKSADSGYSAPEWVISFYFLYASLYFSFAPVHKLFTKFAEKNELNSISYYRYMYNNAEERLLTIQGIEPILYVNFLSYGFPCFVFKMVIQIFWMGFIVQKTVFFTRSIICSRIFKFIFNHKLTEARASEYWTDELSSSPFYTWSCSNKTKERCDWIGHSFQPPPTPSHHKKTAMYLAVCEWCCGCHPSEVFIQSLNLLVFGSFKLFLT